MNVYFYSGLSLALATEPHVHSGLILAESSSDARRKVQARIEADSAPGSEVNFHVMQLRDPISFEGWVMRWQLEQIPNP